MALFGESKKPFSYDIVREGENTILMVDLEEYHKIPSLEDDPVVMYKTCDLIIEAGKITKIIFTQKRNYEYDYSQTLIIREIANLYKQLTKRKDFFSYTALLSDPTCGRWANTWYSTIQHIISNLLRSDPIGAYVELIRLSREERIAAEKASDQQYIKCGKKYVELIDYLVGLLDKTKLITIAKPYIAGYKIGNREVYRKIFSPSIRPDFMFTRLMATFPHDAEELAAYTVGKDTEITIFQLQDTVHYLYHMIPPEFKLTEEKYEILDTARKIMAEHKPSKEEFVNPERMRQVFFNVGRDLIEELIDQRNFKLNSREIEQLTEILVRYTVGFGLIELLLKDEKIQDITINSPMGNIPMFIVHQDFSDCKTNIIPTIPEADS